MRKFLLSLYAVIALMPVSVKAVDVIYQGQVTYPTTNPTGNSPGRIPSDRANDRGINILEYGALGDNSHDDTANIQLAIDTCLTMANHSCTTILCGGATSKRFNITYPIFIDLPNNLRGLDTFVTGANSSTTNTMTAVTLGADVTQPGLYPGMKVSGTGIPANTLITATDTGKGAGFRDVTLSNAATATNSNTVLTFNGGWDSTQNYQAGMIVKYNPSTSSTTNGVPWQSMNALSGVTLTAGGTNWQVNDKFVLWDALWTPSIGGPFRKSALAHVTTVSGTAITGIAIDDGGEYYGASTSYVAIPLPKTGTLGSGATFNTPTFTANTNNAPSVSSTHWRAVTMGITNANNVNQSAAIAFVGPESLPDGELEGHCTLAPQYNTAPAMFAVGNGILIKGVNILFPQGQGYNCQLPPFGIGFAIAGQGTRTKVQNSQVSGVYYGYAAGGDGNPQLGDSNTLEKSQVTGACYAVAYQSTQAFVNSIYDSNLSGNTVVWSYQGTGVNVVGGNLSSTGVNGSEASPGATFTINSASSATPNNTIILTATINLTPAASAPVGTGLYLSDTRCNQQEVDFPSSCVYNGFVINDTKYGLIPFDLIGFLNNGNGTATLALSVSNLFLAPMDNVFAQSAIATHLAAATTLYTSEITTTLGGCGISAKQFHLENLEAPTTMIDSHCGFSQRTNDIDNPYINYDPTLWTAYNSVNAFIAQFLVQSAYPFIRLRGSDLRISGFTKQLGGTIGPGKSGGERLLIDGTTGTNQLFKWSGDAPLLSFRGTNSGGGTSQTFSHGSYPLNTPGLGIGQFDETSAGIAWASFSHEVAISNSVSNQLDDWSSSLMGKTPFMGFRPAPYTTPCLTPAQLTALNTTLPAITHTGTGLDTAYTVSYPSMWGGIAYRACDWNSPSFTFNAATRDATNLFVSTHHFWTYGQDLTTTNVANLSWTQYQQSPVIFANVELLSLLRPGLGFSLTCNAMTFEGIVTDVHPTPIYGPSSNQGYFRYQAANDSIGGPYVFDFGMDCVGQTSNFKQAAFAISVH